MVDAHLRSKTIETADIKNLIIGGQTGIDGIRFCLAAVTNGENLADPAFSWFLQYKNRNGQGESVGLTPVYENGLVKLPWVPNKLATQVPGRMQIQLYAAIITGEGETAVVDKQWVSEFAIIYIQENLNPEPIIATELTIFDQYLTMYQSYRDASVAAFQGISDIVNGEDFQTVLSLNNSIPAVAAMDESIPVVAGMSVSVPLVAGVKDEIPVLAPVVSQIEQLALIKDQIVSLEAEKLKVAAIEAKLAEIQAVHDKLTEIEGVYGKLTEIDALYAQLATIAAKANQAEVDELSDRINTIDADDFVTPPRVFKDDFYAPTIANIIGAIIEEYYINNVGTPVYAENWAYTDYISVVSGNSYEIYGKDSLGETVYSFQISEYDNNNKAFIRMLVNKQFPYTYVMPEGIAYIRLNMGRAYKVEAYVKTEVQVIKKYGVKWLDIKAENISDEAKEYINPDDNKWLGKTIAFLGDSITYGATLDSPTTERYSALVNTGLFFGTELNYGVSGTRLANNVTASGANDLNCMSIRYTSMSDSADIVCVMAGTNDYGSATGNGLYTAPFGMATDSTNATFYGALHVLFKGLINKYLGKPIVIITPIHRNGMITGGYDHLVTNPDTNKTLRDYVNAIREIAEIYGLHVLDLYRNLNINPMIPDIRTTLMPDGLHPNATGHRLIADAIIQYLRNLP